MSLVFVDTGAWLALAVRRDQYHRAAVDHYTRLSDERTRLLTTDYVMLETYTRIRYDDGHRQALQFHETITRALDQGRLELEWVSRQTHEKAWQIFEKYEDQLFSLVDCASFVIAGEARVDQVFGFDRGFLTMGFVLAPGGS